ncbi:hypothetical protein LIER_16740 [Lithospermum erythrorhizon]|uniref:RING-type E3 ubiquitin transferase n=1 Tax=Lithospermum erythrorhizon TaxID=34254 RepID=A0AAV3Q9E6_LITER
MSSRSPQTTPLLPSTTSPPSLRRQSLHQAARFLLQATTTPSPSMLVRESAAEHLEERQTDWAYSKPVVIIDIVWNIGVVLAAFVVVLLSLNERPEVPLRVWVGGYVGQCGVHVMCVVLEYRKRRQRRWQTREEAAEGGGGVGSSGGGYVTLAQFTQQGTSSDAAKHLGSANTMFSFVWWLLGFYWVDAGRQLIGQSPLLYWLCVVFLAFDVFFVVLFIALACLIGVAVCCCLPCIIAILYAVAEQEGASKEEVERLAKYKFQRVDKKYCEGEMQEPGGVMIDCETENSSEHYLTSEDAECCICLSAYDDGDELRELPCCHHFHCTCVDKWLFINATCPLCKYNIMQNSNSNIQEV